MGRQILVTGYSILSAAEEPNLNVQSFPVDRFLGVDVP